MTKISADVQWWNVVNCQNGVALPVLDPKLEGYKVSKVSKLYQCEMCVQLSAQGASIDMPVAKIGNK
eukprot:8033756-Ditylum_brightwellii.AAC.1